MRPKGAYGKRGRISLRKDAGPPSGIEDARGAQRAPMRMPDLALKRRKVLGLRPSGCHYVENASPPQITSGSMEEPAVPAPTHTYFKAVSSQIQSLDVDVSTYSLFVLPTEGSSRAVRTLVQIRPSSLEIFSSTEAAAASALFAASSARFPASLRSSNASITLGVRGSEDDVGFPEIKPRQDCDFAMEPSVRLHDTTNSILPRSSVSLFDKVAIMLVVGMSNTHCDLSNKYGWPSCRVTIRAGVPSGQAAKNWRTSSWSCVALCSP